MPHCSELFLSIIQNDYEGDCWFPPYEDYFSFHDIVYEHEQFQVVHLLKKGKEKESL